MKKLDLGTEKISKLLLTFSIPCIISMLINSVYNIVDQIFIGQGVGTIGNAATNVIFPIVIICNAIASLIGNGCAANLSLRLGEKNYKEATKNVGSSIAVLFIVAIITAILGELFLPTLVNWFGCTPTVYSSAITYGRIILLGAPFMIIYTGLSSIIRADSSPRYSMICLLVGAIINIILDPIFIFNFKLGVAGGAYATIIGQFISFLIACFYLKKFKSFKLKLSDCRPNNSLFNTLSLGISSFITQMTILALFVVMNNLMTKYGANTKFGSDIPLSVYGIISKLNSLYVSSILGISIGAQPIIGFNYGAGNYDRVKQTLKKVVITCFTIGIFFNIIFYFFPRQVIFIFITKTDPNYSLFMEFAIDCCKIFLAICFLNAFEMCSSIVIQSLGNVKKATLVSFIRQIILFIPLSIILSHFIGLYGALYAGPIADSICFICVTFIFFSEYKKLTSKEIIEQNTNIKIEDDLNPKTSYIITIAREYGSGGRYIGQLLAKQLQIPCYDKEIIALTAKNSGFKQSYIEQNEESKNQYYGNDDAIFISQTKVIKKLAKKPCIIIGRCADYVLKDQKNVLNIFLYNDYESKKNRLINYYNIPKKDVKKLIIEKNKERAKYYKYYTENEWTDLKQYDLAIQTDLLGIEKTVDLLKNFVLSKEEKK